MAFIDNKIPPPIIAVICAALAWQISQLTPELTLLWEPRVVVAIAIGLLGLTLDIVSLLAFRRADTILAVIAFIAYITRFQIIPEERALTEKFGQSYIQYRNSVRRWI